MFGHARPKRGTTMKENAKRTKKTAAGADKPLHGAQWAKVLGRRRAGRARRDLVLQLQGVALPTQYRKAARVAIDRRQGALRVSVRTRVVGRHFFPPDIKSVAVPKRRVQDMAAYTEGTI